MLLLSLTRSPVASTLVVSRAGATGTCFSRDRLPQLSTDDRDGDGSYISVVERADPLLNSIDTVCTLYEVGMSEARVGGWCACRAHFFSPLFFSLLSFLPLSSTFSCFLYLFFSLSSFRHFFFIFLVHFLPLRKSVIAS